LQGGVKLDQIYVRQPISAYEAGIRSLSVWTVDVGRGVEDVVDKLVVPILTENKKFFVFTPPLSREEETLSSA